MSLSIPEAAEALRSGSTTSVELTRTALKAIDELDGQLGAFVIVDHEGALEAAERADRALASGEDTGPLAGMPIAVKDIVDIADQPTKCGSAAYPSTPAARDATVVERLKAAHAVIVGKSTPHELACGVYSAPSSNPWATDRVPGGSSGGSGAAVAAGIVPMALGTDTGGSIRIPASLCGITGLKPTYGRVSRVGVEPLAWSLDHIGPLASSVDGAVAALQAMAGEDMDDPTTWGLPELALDAPRDQGVDGLRLGVMSGAPFEPMQPGVAEAFGASVERLGDIGAVLVDVVIPELVHTLAAEFGIVGPEAAAYHREGLQSHPNLIDEAIRSLLVAGLLLPTEQYIRALRARRVITDAIRSAFAADRLDALLSPTLPATAVPKEQEEIDYGSMSEPVTLSYVRTTAPFNLSGVPAMTVPAGFDSDGLPVGLQIASRPYDEGMIVRVGRHFEQLELDTGRLPEVHVDRIAA